MVSIYIKFSYLQVSDKAFIIVILGNKPNRRTKHIIAALWSCCTVHDMLLGSRYPVSQILSEKHDKNSIHHRLED